METSKILSADLLDLIFDDRNKDYGAYELRRSYHKRIKKALLLTFTIALLAITGTVLAGSLKTVKSGDIDTLEVTITDLKEEELPKPPPEQKQPEPEPVRTEQLTTIDVVEDNQVEDPLPTQDDLDSAKIDLKKQDGVVDDGTAGPPQPVDNGKGIIATREQAPEDITYTTVEIEAKYAGNWEKFLLRNLNANVPVDNGAPPGRYPVIVQFTVDKEGNVSDIKTLSNHGYGMEQEALRVLKKAERWEPAIQNGYKVKAYRTQRITFEVNEE